MLEIEINILFGRALVKVRAKIEKNSLFGRGLLKIRAKRMKKAVAIDSRLSAAKSLLPAGCHQRFRC